MRWYLPIRSLRRTIVGFSRQVDCIFEISSHFERLCIFILSITDSFEYYTWVAYLVLFAEDLQLATKSVKAKTIVLRSCFKKGLLGISGEESILTFTLQSPESELFKLRFDIFFNSFWGMDSNFSLSPIEVKEEGKKKKKTRKLENSVYSALTVQSIYV